MKLIKGMIFTEEFKKRASIATFISLVSLCLGYLFVEPFIQDYQMKNFDGYSLFQEYKVNASVRNSEVASVKEITFENDNCEIQTVPVYESNIHGKIKSDSDIILKEWVTKDGDTKYSVDVR